MKCTNYFAIEKYGEKGKTRRVVMRPEHFEGTSKYKHFISSPALCTGTLHISLKIHEEPDWGYSFPVINILFTCSECGPIEFDAKDLPSNSNLDDLNDWINALMACVDAMPYDDVITVENRRQAFRNGAVQALISKGMNPQKALTKVIKEEIKRKIK